MILCNKHIWGQSLSCDPMVVGFTTTCAISVYPHSEVVSSNPFHGEVYSIQHDVLKFVGDL